MIWLIAILDIYTINTRILISETLNVRYGDYKIWGISHVFAGSLFSQKLLTADRDHIDIPIAYSKGLSIERGLVIEYAMVVEFSLLKVEFEYSNFPDFRNFEEVQKIHIFSHITFYPKL